MHARMERTAGRARCEYLGAGLDIPESIMFCITPWFGGIVYRYYCQSLRWDRFVLN
jgi:hypothetical protein